VKKNNILILLFLGIFASLVIYFSIPIIRDRYWESKNKNVEITKPAEPPKTETTGSNEETINSDDTNAAGDTNNERPKITAKDCDNNCAGFDNTNGNLDYCNQICNLNEPPTVPEDCSKMTDLNKDYCYKDKAIADKNLKLCDSVNDATIKKACKNRVSEDLIDLKQVQE
jgi:hypothetical protein